MIWEIWVYEEKLYGEILRNWNSQYYKFKVKSMVWIWNFNLIHEEEKWRKKGKKDAKAAKEKPMDVHMFGLSWRKWKRHWHGMNFMQKSPLTIKIYLIFKTYSCTSLI